MPTIRFGSEGFTLRLYLITKSLRGWFNQVEWLLKLKAIETGICSISEQGVQFREDAEVKRVQEKSKPIRNGDENPS
jgi:hypothetical protein